MIDIYASIKTTGTIPWKHGITEIALLASTQEKVIDQTFTRMNPGEVDIDPKALEINGEDATTISQLMPQQYAFNVINNFLSKHKQPDEKFMLIAYNAPFVYDFIMNFFKRNIEQPENPEEKALNPFFDYFYSPALDVMQVANLMLKEIRPNIPDFKLPTICSAFELLPQRNNSCIQSVRQVYMLYNKLISQ